MDTLCKKNGPASLAKIMQIGQTNWLHLNKKRNRVEKKYAPESNSKCVFYWRLLPVGGSKYEEVFLIGPTIDEKLMTMTLILSLSLSLPMSLSARNLKGEKKLTVLLERKNMFVTYKTVYPTPQRG